MKTIEQRIIAKQDELIAWLVKYTKPESIRYDKFHKDLADLKAQLKEQEEAPKRVLTKEEIKEIWNNGKPLCKLGKSHQP